jgi:hypothetical protein
MAIRIQRREFIVTLSGAAAAPALGQIARTETYPSLYAGGSATLHLPPWEHYN